MVQFRIRKNLHKNYVPIATLTLIIFLSSFEFKNTGGLQNNCQYICLSFFYLIKLTTANLMQNLNSHSYVICKSVILNVALNQSEYRALIL